MIIIAGMIKRVYRKYTNSAVLAHGFQYSFPEVELSFFSLYRQHPSTKTKIGWATQMYILV